MNRPHERDGDAAGAGTAVSARRTASTKARTAARRTPALYPTRRLHVLAVSRRARRRSSARAAGAPAGGLGDERRAVAEELVDADAVDPAVVEAGEHPAAR